MVGPAERVLSTISSPFPWVAPMVIHKFDPPRLIMHNQIPPIEKTRRGGSNLE